MARRTASELYEDAIAAGVSPAAAVVQTAIALAATGGDTDARVEAPTGTAVGALLTRVMPEQTGTGSPRDVARIAGDPRAQAAAAAQISDGGRDWSSWEVFRNGQYAGYLGQAQAAAAASSPAQASPAAGPGPSWAPWNWGDALGQRMGGARDVLLLVLLAAGGVVLVGAGAAQMVAPKVYRRAEQSARTAVKAVL